MKAKTINQILVTAVLLLSAHSSPLLAQNKKTAADKTAQRPDEPLPSVNEKVHIAIKISGNTVTLSWTANNVKELGQLDVCLESTSGTDSNPVTKSPHTLKSVPNGSYAVYMTRSPQLATTPEGGIVLTDVINRALVSNKLRFTIPSIPSAEGKTIDDALFQMLLKDITAKGEDIKLPPVLTNPLGISASNEALLCRGKNYSGRQYFHGVSKLPNDQGYLLSVRDKPKTYIRNYYVNKDLVLQAAVLSTGSGITTIPNKQAKEELNNELSFFAKLAENL